jgi:hypothetical protein
MERGESAGGTSIQAVDGLARTIARELRWARSQICRM